MIVYVKGDATYPQGIGKKVIVHICNDMGYWGRGFVLAITARWKKPEQAYKNWCALYEREHGCVLPLGEVQFVGVEDDIVVANLIGQHDIRGKDGRPPIRYHALRTGLMVVDKYATETKSTIHMPRIGAGLAGGSWPDIEYIINDVLKEHTVFVYDLR